jgi:hypothetical protein
MKMPARAFFRILASVPALSLVLAAGASAAPVQRPEQTFGFRPGADYRLADYGQIVGYFRALDAASDRVIVREMGPSAEGRPMIYALLSSEANLRRLDHYLEISRKLALARDLDESQARALAAEGKAIVWIDAGLHATEMAPSQHAPELAYRVATEETPEMRRIREDVILALVPVMNPDGLEKVTAWYGRNLGTAYEVAPMVELYHKYIGHDNNRDWYMFNMPESRNVARLLYQELLPQIVYNHHQVAPFPARIFVPPFEDPMNPNIPPLVMRGIATVGDAITARLEQEGKRGAVSRVAFDTWWNGGMRTAPYFHNMVGILTETALWYYATPHEYDPKTLPKRFRDGTPADIPTTFYPSPWRGGWWRLRDAVDYIMTASLATLDIGSKRREEWLLGMYRMGREAIETGAKGDPYAYVIPAGQRDSGSAARLVEVLRTGGIEVTRAQAGFRAGDRSFPAGSFVVRMAQPFRAYAKDLLEVQTYPERRGPGGAPARPYDITGWTLPAQMGVEAVAVAAPLQADLAAVDGPIRDGSLAGTGEVFLVGPSANAAFLLANRVRAAGGSVSRATEAFKAAGQDFAPGTFLLRGGLGREAVETLARDHNLAVTAVAAAPAVKTRAAATARVGLHKPWVASMDEGWTRWLLEEYGFPYTTLLDADIRKGTLREAFDVIVLADSRMKTMLDGHAPGVVPPEYTGGFGLQGALTLKAFVESGGTLVALDSAAELPVELFSLGVRNSLSGVSSSEYFCPGAVLSLRFDASQPLAWGMPEEAFAFVEGGSAFEEDSGGERPDRPAPTRAPLASDPRTTVARFADKDVLYSGYLLGASRLQGKAALMEVSLGQGRVVLIGFRAQFRGQSHGTFKVLFNALI